MSQESRTKWITKFLFFFSVTSFSCLWVTGYASHSESSTQVQWLAQSYSTVWVYPLWLASLGWSSPAILPPQDRTENLTVNSPTLQPLNHVVDEISCPNVSIYAQGILNYQGNSEIKNLKNCIDQELNWGSPGCLCHPMTYTTRPKVHIQEQQICPLQTWCHTRQALQPAVRWRSTTRPRDLGTRWRFTRPVWGGRKGPLPCRQAELLNE